MLQVIRDLKIVIFSHDCAAGACEELSQIVKPDGILYLSLWIWNL